MSLTGERSPGVGAGLWISRTRENGAVWRGVGASREGCGEPGGEEGREGQWRRGVTRGAVEGAPVRSEEPGGGGRSGEGPGTRPAEGGQGPYLLFCIEHIAIVCCLVAVISLCTLWNCTQWGFTCGAVGSFSGCVSAGRRDILRRKPHRLPRVAPPAAVPRAAG